ncbi:MAG: hypothetical protein V4450_03855 [Bacteroidota bacterium]
MNLITTILNYIDIGAPLVTLLFFIKPFRKLPKELRYIFWFVCIQFATNLVATCLELMMTTNYTVYVTNIILSFVVLSILFYQAGIPFIRRLVPVASLVFIVSAVYSIANGDGILTYNSVLSAIGSFVITAYCMIFFYWRLVKDAKLSGLTDSAFFWIVIGIFTYYTGSFFIFISYKLLIVQEASIIGILWRFHNLLLSIFCIYTIYGLTCKNYQKT